jgi:hypothetical protein
MELQEKKNQDNQTNIKQNNARHGTTVPVNNDDQYI